MRKLSLLNRSAGRNGQLQQYFGDATGSFPVLPFARRITPRLLAAAGAFLVPGRRTRREFPTGVPLSMRDTTQFSLPELNDRQQSNEVTG